MLEPSFDHTAPSVAAPAAPSRLAALGQGLDRSLGLLAGLSFASQLIVASMLPVLPLFARELGATPRMLALMVAVSAIAAAGGQLVGGLLSDRVGARRLIPVGMAGYGVASLLTSMATTAVPVVALRSLSGLGSGAYIIGERLYIRQVVDRARLAFANSLAQAAGAVGVVIGPLIGGAVAEANDLRAPLLVATGASVVVAVIALLLPSRRHKEAAVETAAAPVRVDRTGLGILLLANLAFVAGYGSFITTFTPYASESLRWTTTEIGLAFALFGLGNIAGAPILGAAADRLGRRPVGVLSMIPIVAFAAALVLTAPDALLYLLALLAGCGTAGFTASWYTLLGVASGGARSGGVFGTVAGVSSLGIIIGALAAGELWERIDVRAAMVVTVVAMSLAALILAAYRGEKAARSRLA